MTTLVPKYDNGATGSINRPITQKVNETISVLDFIDATQHPFIKSGVIASQNAVLITAGFNAALVSLATNGSSGGTLIIPEGQYLVTGGGIVFNTINIRLTLQGHNAILNCQDGGVIFDYACASQSQGSFSIDGVNFTGTSGANPTGTGLYISGFSNQGTISNCFFNGLEYGVKLYNVYQTSFISCRWNNYITGITGTVGGSSQNNSFVSCAWNDGKVATPAVAVPISSYNMGYNLYSGCNFESSGYIKSVDMRSGGGYDTFINSRFERCNSGTDDWLICGNNGTYINTAFYPTSYEDRITNNTFLINIPDSATGNTFNGIAVDSAYGPNTVYMGVASTNNFVKFISPPSTEGYLQVYRVIRDLGISNTIEYSKSTMVGQKDSFGASTINFVTDSLNLAGATGADGWVYTGIANNSSTEIGPHNDGYVRDFVYTSGDGAYYKAPISSSGTGYTYTFSVWVKSKATQEDIYIALTSDGTPAAIDYKIVRISNNWERIWIQTKALPLGGSIYAFIKNSTGGATGIYVYGPQLEESFNNTCTFGPGGYIRTSSAACISSGASADTPLKICRGHRLGDAIPTVGTWTKGEVIFNINTAAGGTPGWVCTTSGTPGTWKAMANVAA